MSRDLHVMLGLVHSVKGTLLESSSTELKGNLLLFKVLRFASWEVVSYRGTVLVGFPL